MKCIEFQLLPLIQAYGYILEINLQASKGFAIVKCVSFTVIALLFKSELTNCTEWTHTSLGQWS